MLACSFHPELTDDPRLHALLMAMATARARADRAGDRPADETRRPGDDRSRASPTSPGSWSATRPGSREGETCVIEGSTAAEPLVAAVYEEVLRAGGNPIVALSFEGQSATYYREATDAQLEWVSPLSEWAAEEADCRIAIGADTNTRELSGVAPERQTTRQAATRHLMETTMERAAEGEHRWVYTLYPTNAYASDAEMSLRDFEDFYFRACLADDGDPLGAWKRASEECHRLAEWIEGHEEVHITAPGTDLRLGSRRPPLHPLRRRAQHARRRVLHRPDRGLGRGRGLVPPAGDDRRPRGRRRAAALRGRQGRRRAAPSAARSS